MRRCWFFSALLAIACASVPPDTSVVPVTFDVETLRVDAARALSRGAHAEAARLYGMLVEADPSDPNAFLALGYARIRLDRWVEGEEAFREALFLRPASGEAHLGLGVSLHGQGRVEEAREVLRSGLETLEDESEREAWRFLVSQRLPGIDLR